MQIIVFKIITAPIPDEELSQIQKFELNRKIENSTVHPEIFKSLNPNFSTIYSVYKKEYEVDTEGLYQTDNSDELISFDNFITLCESRDENRSNPTGYIGWNCYSFDQPHINFNIYKNKLPQNLRISDINKFNNNRARPVIDLMTFLYSGGYSSSLISTCDSFGIKVDDVFNRRDYLERVYSKRNYEELNDFLYKKGELISKLFEKTYKYYL